MNKNTLVGAGAAVLAAAVLGIGGAGIAGMTRPGIGALGRSLNE